MAIDYDRLKAWRFDEIRQSYGARETILYALGIGLGHDATDEAQLRFVYEKDHQVLPTMAMVLGTPGFWQANPATGIDAVRAVHGEQGLVLHRPLPREATIIAKSRVTAIIDKGEGKGALVAVQRTITDAATEEPIATVEAVTFCRADGGFGGRGDTLPPPHVLPDRAPDAVHVQPTVPQAALIYRLSGDRNPLHAEPAIARAAGFERPILHGLCTMGIAGHAVLRTFGAYRPELLRSLRVRFSAPVYPGERIRTEMWRDDDVVSFRSYVEERNMLVLTGGRAEIGEPC
ncbi:MAG TPA: MaoC/PaaZ C-terminal domain-containing protein [Casimicrobiaceae bacterium]|nr:MaoC/PaaZ C-terminal domain-containing protein [Casimicrobiaceae bacterium]